MIKTEQKLRLGTSRYEEGSSMSFDTNLSMMSDRVCLDLFRFKRPNIERIVALLAWPDAKRPTYFIRYNSTPKLSVCIMLARLATPDRLCDMENVFGKF